MTQSARITPVVFVHGSGWLARTPEERSAKAAKFRCRMEQGLRMAQVDPSSFDLRVLNYLEAESGRHVVSLRDPEHGVRSEGLPSGRFDCSCCTRSAKMRARKSLGRGLKILNAHEHMAERLLPTEVADYLYDTSRRDRRLGRLAGWLPETPYILWGHSLGSVVALELAAHLPPECRPSVLVTSGSPLSIGLVRQHLLPGVERWAASARAVPWVSVFDKADLITKYAGLAERGFGPVVDIEVRNSSPHSGSRHLAHLQVWECLAPLAQN